MAIVLNGTTGITNDGGYTGDGVVFADTTPANTLVTTTGGNVGIGTSLPAQRLDINGQTDVRARLLLNGTAASQWQVVSGETRLHALGATALGFWVNGGESGRFDSSGNLLVGTTDTSMGGLKGIRVGNGAATGAGLVIAGVGAANKGFLFSSSAGVALETAPGAVAQVISGGGGGVSLANGATSWSAISDERHKDIIEPISNAANKVASLRAVIGKYKTDETETRRAFLIAQDVQAVLPEAVDSTDADSLALRYSDLTPLLVAAIQEQQAIITAQAAQIQQLREKVLEVEEGTSNMLVENTNNLYETITALTARVAALEGK